MPVKPNFGIERKHGGIVAGLDEAGRGPWAGPVVASAVILNPRKIPKGINDSKALTREEREALYTHITTTAAVGIGSASVEEIDSLNILRASLLAMERALAMLNIIPDLALVDGNRPPTLPCPVQCIVKGDGESLSIAAASIIAKVTRDRLMRELHEQYPHYGFDSHMGYGTPQHQDALARHGVTPHHRRSFAPIRALLTVAEVA